MDIDLLPWRSSKRYRAKKQLMTGFAVMVVVTACVVCLLRHYAHQVVSHQIGRNRLLQTEIAAFETVSNEVNALDIEQKTLLIRMNTLRHLQENGTSQLRFLNDLVKTLPSGVYLSHLARHNNKITLSGFSDSNRRLSEFMSNLTHSRWARDPGMSDGNKPGSATGWVANEFHVRFLLT